MASGMTLEEMRKIKLYFSGSNDGILDQNQKIILYLYNNLTKTNFFLDIGMRDHFDLPNFAPSEYGHRTHKRK